MTSPQRSLFPASGDDQGALLCTLELVARSGLQLVEVVWAIVRQRMPLEPGLQIFDRVHVGRVWRQKSDLAMSIDAVQIVAHEPAAMRFQAVPDPQQQLFQVRFERFEKTDDFFFLDAAFVQPEQAIGARQASDDGDMVPVEVKLNHRRLSFQIPGAHLRGTFAEARFVDKDDQAAFSPGFF